MRTRAWSRTGTRGMVCIAAWALSACSGTSADDKADTGVADADADADTDSDADTDTDTDTDTDVDTDTDEPTACASELTATIREGGAPLTGVELRLCRGLLCRTGDTDAQGSYRFGGVPPEWHSFEPVVEGGLATPLVPLLFDCASSRDVTLDVLPLGPESALGSSPEEHPVGAGLTLTASVDDLEPPLFFDPAESVSGVRVPEVSWPPIDGLAGTVLAVWYLAPFNYAAASPDGLPIRIDNEWAFADGTALEVYVGSYDDNVWLPGGTATVNGADLVGAALPLVSTVVLIQPE